MNLCIIRGTVENLIQIHLKEIEYWLYMKRLKKKGKMHKRHGKSGTKEYRSWGAMKERCYSKNHSQYYLYGKRGISVCDQWINDFETFLRDMGEKPTPAHTIDRIDVNGNYCPENCKWSTPKEQSLNKRTNKIYTFLGMTMTVKEWCDYSGISRTTLYTRLITMKMDFYDSIKMPMRVDIQRLKGLERRSHKWKQPNHELGYEKRLKFYKQIGIIDDSGNNSTIS